MLTPFVPILPTLGNMLLSFQQSSMSGKSIILVLIIFSVLAWTVMISRFVELFRCDKESKRFIAAYRHETHPVSLFLKQRPFPDTPLYLIYDKACQALGTELGERSDSADLFARQVPPPESRISPVQLEVIRNLIERNVADQALLLEDYMGFLAIAVNVAPFLGLLGTVWGVMEAFGGMAITGSATLSAVAPGISAALLTTVVGLLVALPSSIGYNVLTNKIRHITVDMDNFAQELHADIQRTFTME